MVDSPTNSSKYHSNHLLPSLGVENRDHPLLSPRLVLFGFARNSCTPGYGWMASLLEGCPVLGWQETQQRFYSWIGSCRTGARWLSQVICKAWDVAWDQWEHRNGILHGVDQGILMQGIDAQIRAQYSQGSAFLPRDVRIFFRISLPNLLLAAPATRDAWLKRVCAARERQSRLGNGGYQQERQAIAAWLQN